MFPSTDRLVPRTEESVGVGLDVARVDTIPSYISRKYLKNKSPIFPSQFYPEFIRLVSICSPTHPISGISFNSSFM